MFFPMLTNELRFLRNMTNVIFWQDIFFIPYPTILKAIVESLVE